MTDRDLADLAVCPVRMNLETTVLDLVGKVDKLERKMETQQRNFDSKIKAHNSKMEVLNDMIKQGQALDSKGEKNHIA